MTEEKKKRKNRDEHRQPLGTTLAFGLGAMTDQMSHQMFQFLIFIYFYSVIGIKIESLALGFFIFAVWDSINDPIMGPISDRTKSKFGRRRVWILIITIPFALVNFFLFFFPGLHTQPDWVKTTYFIVIIMLYDLFYTIFSTNQLALFPEMFKTEKERSRANMWKNIMTIIGVLIGFVMPTLFIGSEVAPTVILENLPQIFLDRARAELMPRYWITGGVVAILVLIGGFMFFKFGMKEDPVELTQKESDPGVFHSLKMTFKNKAFIIFILANLFNWFVFKTLTTAIPLYGQFVLGFQEGDFMLTIMLLTAFLSATAFFPLMRLLGNKIGMRNAFIVSEAIWIVALIPFTFLREGGAWLGLSHNTWAVIFMGVNGIGLSGAMFFVDVIMGNIIDEDEINNGVRREGAYYGINALINRYSTIFSIGAIALVFAGQGWATYIINPSDIQGAALQVGIRWLMIGFTIAGILIVILLLSFFPLHGERLKKVKEQIAAKQTVKN
ncbi:MAG: MFS transporter [Promethearchaeota archaeon]|nr:MAG: MFS transporter [Candidatus Lokiarchaeota archaeon]